MTTSFVKRWRCPKKSAGVWQRNFGDSIEAPLSADEQAEIDESWAVEIARRLADVDAHPENFVSYEQFKAESAKLLR